MLAYGCKIRLKTRSETYYVSDHSERLVLMEWILIQNLLVKEWKVDEEDDKNRRGDIHWTTSSSLLCTSIASGAGYEAGPCPGKS